MDWPTVLRGIAEVLASDLDRADKAGQVAALIREAGRYRWVGLYAVTEREIVAIGWNGPGPDPATGTVLGTLDLESAERDAFTAADRRALERCATALTGLFAEAGA